MGFRDVFERDLNRWLTDAARPWVSERAATTKIPTTTLSPPSKYYDNIESDFRRLNIAGIDNDRTFEIPLSEIYVRLRFMFGEDDPEESEDHEICMASWPVLWQVWPVMWLVWLAGQLCG